MVDVDIGVGPLSEETDLPTPAEIGVFPALEVVFAVVQQVLDCLRGDVVFEVFLFYGYRLFRNRM